MNINIWTTTRCNLSCTYCYETINQQKGTEELTVTMANNIIDWIISNNIVADSINFHGGEPLLNYTLILYITDRLAKKNQLPKRMGLTTNGTIWNERIKEFFQTYADIYKNGISISIDGTEYNHNLTRHALDRTGSYAKVVKTAKNLLDIFPYTRARMTVTSDSAKYLYENIRHVAELGFKNIAPVLDIYDTNWNEENMDILKHEMIKVIEYWKNNQEVNISLINDILYRRPKGKCEFSYNISIHGDIYPCIDAVGIDNYCIGNVIEGIDSKRVLELHTMVNTDYEFCKTCNNIRYCTISRCKFINYCAEKSLVIPSKVGCRFEGLKYEVSKYLFNM